MNFEHVTFLFNEVPSVLTILGSLNWHIKASLSHINLVRDVRIDGQGGRLNISFTELTEAALSRRPVFLPDLQLLVLDALFLLSDPFLVLESEDFIITWILEWIGLLLEPK